MNIDEIASNPNLTVAETAMGKLLFKASDGGQIDIVREREDVTKGELQ